MTLQQGCKHYSQDLKHSPFFLWAPLITINFCVTPKMDQSIFLKMLPPKPRGICSVVLLSKRQKTQRTNIIFYFEWNVSLCPRTIEPLSVCSVYDSLSEVTVHLRSLPLLTHLFQLTSCHLYSRSVWYFQEQSKWSGSTDAIVTERRWVNTTLGQDQECTLFSVLWESKLSCMEQSAFGRSVGTHSLPEAMLICSYKDTISSIVKFVLGSCH